MEGFLRDLVGDKRFPYMVFRSLLLTILIIIMGNEYYQAIQGNILGGIFFTLSLFFLIYLFYLRRELKYGQKSAEVGEEY